MRAASVLLGAGFGLAMSAWSTAPPMTGKPLPAVWKEQHIQFFYAGRTSRYSCDGLQEKVRALLLEMGARRDLKIDSGSCDERAASLQLAFSSPALPGAATKPLHRGDLSALDARFETFTLTNDVAFRNFGIADCELVEEFTRQVLPKLETRDIRQDITCVPYQASGSRYFVRGEVLRNLPRDEQRPGNADSVAP
jgi:hypothetical protein